MPGFEPNLRNCPVLQSPSKLLHQIIMNFIPRIFFLTLFTFFMISSGLAQKGSLSDQDLSNIKIDNFSDEEISNYYQKAVESGLSEDDIFKILQQRSLPREEIDKLAIRLQKVNQNKFDKKPDPNNNKDKANTDTKANKSRQVDDQVSPVEQNENDLAVFGSELFTTNSMVFEPNLRIATPSGYILGPDDELVINVYGYSEKTYNVTVNEEGNIYIQQVGPVYVNGLSIEEATTKIRAKFASTIYRAINNGQTRVQISLGKIRSIRVTVIGEASKPGTYTVSSLTTLFNLLYLCGGPTDLGSYRKIELIRGSDVKRVVDLYAFLTKGDQKDNVLLREGDVIRIPYYKTRVLLNGNVRRKGKYELVEGETFSELLGYSGGFSDDAYKSDITVYQFTETARRIITVSRPQFKTFQPSSSDSIFVGKLLDRIENKLVIKGAVMRPGEYQLIAGLTLKDLILQAGGLNEDVYSQRGSISRLNANRTPSQLSFNIDSVMKSLVTIPLKKSDEVMIYSIFDLKTNTEVGIDGVVRRPGKFKWAENLTLKDIVLAAGGFGESADLSNIEIARRIENINLQKLNHIQTEIIKVDMTDSTTANDVILEPYDVINVRPRPGFISQRNVFIEGLVMNPGRYTLKMSGDRITDVLNRTGGFRPNADTSSLVIRRLVKENQSLEVKERIFSKLLKIREDSLTNTENLRKEIFKDYDNISIDLMKAIKFPNSSENMLLEDGDVLTIERNTHLVKISGEVYFPTIIPFKPDESLKYYIEKSGSYTSYARKSGVLVVYPDGKAKKVKHFLFFKSYPKVVSRAEIFVPQKSDKNKHKVTIGEWSVMLSSLAILANVIFNLGK